VKEKKEEKTHIRVLVFTSYDLLSSNLISLKIQPLLEVLFFNSELSKKAKRSEIKFQVWLVNGEQESLSTATSKTWY